MGFSPNNTIIIFDIHGVLCKTSYRSIVRLFWQSNKKLLLIRYFFSPRLWRDVFRLWRQDAVAGTYLAYLKAHYPKLIPCIPLFIHMANSQNPNMHVLEIIKKLKGSGFTLDILSNIDDEILDDLRTTQCGQMLTYFDEVVGTAAHSYGKPSPDIYKDFITEHNSEHKKMIFIDNRRRNVRAAKKVGMTGIRFKNAGQLEKQLEKLGIIAG